MRLKKDFILFSNINNPPKREKSEEDNHSSSIFKKIPTKILEQKPEIRKAFKPDKKPYINRIKKEAKTEYIKLDNNMNDKDVKLFSKINDIKELVYENDKENEELVDETIVEENEKFEKNYKRLKKDKNKFNRGSYLDYEAFLNISNQYVAKNMRVPNLSEDHNLFSGNPLILQGSELENFIVYNLGDKNKGVNFLNRLDDYLEKKISGNTEINVKEKIRLEKLRQLEKPKGYIPPEVEIPMLKNDINKSENSIQNIVELEEFFKPRKRIFRPFILKKNNSSFNIFNNSIENTPPYKFKRASLNYYNLDNAHQNNSGITATTSIGITRKSSPKKSKKNNILNFNNMGLNSPKEFKLPKLDTPIRSPSGIFKNSISSKNNNNMIRIRKISFNNNLKNDWNSNSRNIQLSPIFNSVQNNIKVNSNIDNNANKKYKLLKLSNNQSFKDANKKEKEKYNTSITSDSEVNDILELNKEIENNRIKEEIKDNDEIVKKEYEKNNKENKNENPKLNSNEKFKFRNKLINTENNKNNPDKDKKRIYSLVMPNLKLNTFKKRENSNNMKKNKSVDEIRLYPNDDEYNKVESLFNITKEKDYNLKKETKNDIESYLGSKGKNLKQLMTTKGTYFNLHNLMKKSLERNLILEEYFIRNRFNVKMALTSKQKSILNKNKNFEKEIVKQESKLSEIIYKDKKMV